MYIWCIIFPSHTKKKEKKEKVNPLKCLHLIEVSSFERIFQQIYISNSWLNYSINCLQVEYMEWVSCSASQIRKITVNQTGHT